MRKLGVSILVLVMLGAAVGCDSDGDDGPADAEVFIGSWRLASLLLTNQGASQDVTALLLASATVDIDFETSTFTLDVNTADSTTTFAGTYSINEAQKTTVLTSSEFSAPVTIQYEIDNNDQISLETADVALFVDLTGFDLTALGLEVDTITLVIRRSG